MLPGLNPFREDRPDVSRKGPGRVVPKDEGIREMPRLRATVKPVDTFAQAPKPVRDDSLTRLAESLSSLNPALMKFGAALVDGEDREDAEFKRKINSMTPAEAIQKAKDGSDPEFSGRLSKAKNIELFAATVTRDVTTKGLEEWAASSKDGLDAEAFIAAKNKEILDTYGNQYGKPFIDEYTRLSKTEWDKIRNGQIKHNVEKTNAEQMQGAASLFQLTVEKAKSEGRTDDEIAGILRKEINGNRLMAGLDPRQQEEELLKQAEAWAMDGNVGLVRAVVNSKGTNGISLLDNREHGVKAYALIEKADNAAREKAREAGFDANQKWFDASSEGKLDREAFLADHKANPGRMSDEFVRGTITRNDTIIAKRQAEVEKITTEQMHRKAADERTVALMTHRRQAIQTGQYWKLDDAEGLKNNGEPNPITADQNQELAVSEYLKDSARYAEQHQETPQQRFDRELPVVLENGFVHPEWKTTMKGGYSTASVSTLSGDAAPARLQESLAMYKELHARAPHLIPDLVEKDAGQFYEYMRVATEEMSLPNDKAISVVMQLTKDPVKLRQMVPEATRREMEKQVRSFKNASNSSYVYDEISKVATIYTGMGNSPKKSIELARKNFESSHININGSYIARNDRRLPPTFEQDVMIGLKKYVEKHGKEEGIELSDLTIQPATSGSGAWEIVRVMDRLPVNNSSDRMFSTRDVLQWRKELEETKNTENKRRQGVRMDMYEFFRNNPSHLTGSGY